MFETFAFILGIIFMVIIFLIMWVIANFNKSWKEKYVKFVTWNL